MLKIYKVFSSIQGEGTLVGVPSLFIRTHGCNLKCSWCDTPETSVDAAKHEFLSYTPDQFIEEYAEGIAAHDNIVITGGEPCLQAKELVPVVRHLRDLGKHITVETNGSISNASVESLYRRTDLVSMSPKLHELWDTQDEIFRRLWFQAIQVKVVVQTPNELPVAVCRLAGLYDAARATLEFVGILQPEFSRGLGWAKEVANYVLSNRVPSWLRVVPQVHQLIGVE